MEDRQQTEKQQFVEHFGIVFERTGLPKMTGRIFGWLLISDPPYQSTDQLAEALLASKGSISTTTRLLIQTNLIERFTLPGVRHDYFRLRPDAWRNLIKHGVEDELKMIRQLAEQGMQSFTETTPLTQACLERMHNMYAFFEREFPLLLERWEQEKVKE